MKIPSKTISHLKRSKIPHQVTEHKTVFTAYDLGQTLKTRLEEIAKTLLIRVGSAYYVVVLRASDRLDLKKLQTFLGAPVKIARESDMQRHVKVKAGTLTPFGSLHKLPVVLDKGLARSSHALFGSGSFEHSIRIKVKDYLKLEQPKIAAFGSPTGLKLQVKTKPTKKRAQQ